MTTVNQKHTQRNSKKYPQGLQFLDVIEYVQTHFEWQGDEWQN